MWSAEECLLREKFAARQNWNGNFRCWTLIEKQSEPEHGYAKEQLAWQQLPIHNEATRGEKEASTMYTQSESPGSLARKFR